MVKDSDHETSQLDSEDIVKQCIIFVRKCTATEIFFILTALCHDLICNIVLGYLYIIKQDISSNKINKVLSNLKKGLHSN